MKISVCLFNFSFCCLLNEMYSRVICSEEGLMKMAENVQRLKQNVFSKEKLFPIAVIWFKKATSLPKLYHEFSK